MKKFLFFLFFLFFISCTSGEYLAKWTFTGGAVIDDASVFDLNGDGNDEIIIGATHHVSKDVYSGYTYLLDPNGTRYLTIRTDGEVKKVSGIDAAGNRMIVIAGGDTLTRNRGLIDVFDNKGVKIWGRTFEASATSLEIYDVTSDGKDDIIVGTEAGRIYAMDALTGDIIAQTETSPHSILSIRGERDGSGNVRVIAGSASSRAYVLDGNLNAISFIDTGGEVRGISFLDNNTFLLGSDGVYAVTYNGNCTLLWHYPSSHALWDMKPCDLYNSGSVAILGASGTYVGVDMEYIGKLDVLKENGSLQWSKTAPIGYLTVGCGNLDLIDGCEVVVGGANKKVEIYNSTGTLVAAYNAQAFVNKIIIKDIDNDGFQNVLASTKAISFYDIEPDEKSKGDFLYTISKGYFDIYDAKNTTRFALEAKRWYSAANSTTDIDKCNALLTKALKIEEADNTYETAERSYRDKDYENAKKYAEDANAKYTEIGYGEGKIKAKNIMENAGRYIGAKESEEKAMECYETHDYACSRTYYSAAAEIYRLLGEQSKKIECESMLRLSETYVSADSYMLRAKNAFINDDYGIATNYTITALGMYRDLNDSESATTAKHLLSKINLFYNSTALSAPAQQNVTCETQGEQACRCGIEDLMVETRSRYSMYTVGAVAAAILAICVILSLAMYRKCKSSGNAKKDDAKEK